MPEPRTIYATWCRGYMRVRAGVHTLLCVWCTCALTKRRIWGGGGMPKSAPSLPNRDRDGLEDFWYPGDHYKANAITHSDKRNTPAIKIFSTIYRHMTKYIYWTHLIIDKIYIFINQKTTQRPTFYFLNSLHVCSNSGAVHDHLFHQPRWPIENHKLSSVISFMIFSFHTPPWRKQNRHKTAVKENYCPFFSLCVVALWKQPQIARNSS